MTSQAILLEDVEPRVDSTLRPQTSGKFTAIVTLYNAAAHAIDLVDMMLAQQHPDYPNQQDWLRVLFIDDGSPDATVRILELALAERGNPQHIQVYRNRKNLGLARSLNRALHLCATEYVLTCQYDCRFGSSHYLADMLSLLERHPDAAAIAGRPTPSAPIPFEQKLNLVENVIDILPPQELPDIRGSQELVYSGFAEGRCDGFRLSAIRDAGYYDVNLRISGEDQVLSGRFRELGYNVYQAPRLVYLMSLSSEQDSIRRLLLKQHLYGKTHPYILLRARETFSGLIGKKAGRNRRARVVLRASQVLSTLGYVAALALLPFSWTAALGILASLALMKVLVFQKHSRHMRMTGPELLFFAALQPAFDVCYTAGLTQGLLYLITHGRKGTI